jgi:hypothetical protein
LTALALRHWRTFVGVAARKRQLVSLAVSHSAVHSVLSCLRQWRRFADVQVLRQE